MPHIFYGIIFKILFHDILRKSCENTVECSVIVLCGIYLVYPGSAITSINFTFQDGIIKDFCSEGLENEIKMSDTDSVKFITLYYKLPIILT